MEYIDETYSVQHFKEYYKRHGSLPECVIEKLIETSQFYENFDSDLFKAFDEVRSYVPDSDVLYSVTAAFEKLKDHPDVTDSMLPLLNKLESAIETTESDIRLNADLQRKELDKVDKMLNNPIPMFEPISTFQTTSFCNSTF